MTDRKYAYETYRAEFGHRLEQAAVTGSEPERRRRGRLLLATGIVGAIVLGAGALLLEPGGETQPDVVAEARAALPDEGELVHLVTVTTLNLIGADEAALRRFEEFARRHHNEYAPRRFEQWSAGNRWRVAVESREISAKMFAGPPFAPGFKLEDDQLARIGLDEEGVAGPVQEAYADGVDTLYVENLDALIISRLPQGSSSELGTLPGGIYVGNPTLLGGDPVAWLREALESGNLRDAGSAEIDGRPVRRLVNAKGSVDFEYAVDAETFEPVRVRMLGGWVGERDSEHPPETMAEDVHFEVFETMPLNAETQTLLEIQPESSPTIVETKAPDPPRGGDMPVGSKAPRNGAR